MAETWYLHPDSARGEAAIGTLSADGLKWTIKKINPGDYIHIGAGNAHSARSSEPGKPLKYLAVLSTSGTRNKSIRVPDPWQ